MQQQQQHVLAFAKRKQMRAQRRLAGKVKPPLRRSGHRRGERLLGHPLDRKPWPRHARLQYQLARSPKRVGEDGAQALVPLDHIAQRRFQRRCIESARQPHRQRNVVGRAQPFQAMQEPQPSLGK